MKIIFDTIIGLLWGLLPIIVILAFVEIVPMFDNPIRRPIGMVRSYILGATPMGSNIHDVIEIINDKDDWENARPINNRGYVPRPSHGTSGAHHTPIGEKTVDAILGHYRIWRNFFGLMEVRVGATWIFDANGELIEVIVRRAGVGF